ncbi:phytosulfokine receptor 1 [Aristolochia californica]|uniref:phytosulfokine receptor 1 n=1 Tax=Aristolochia californica TaxID=171875 RepID=UPI0035E081C6
MDPAIQALVAATASFVIVTILFGLIYLFFRTNRKKNKRRDRVLSHQITNPSSLFDSASFDPSLRHISLPDLVDATRNFASDGIVGDGSFGFVYKAQLPGGPTVAVKKLDRNAFQGFREFRAEMETLGKIRHENLVRILGYCISGADRLLIYEFIERGSLDYWLHESTQATATLTSLPWPTRVQIMRGVATGLEYLHNGCVPRIIHRDIKASNVLLDADFRAHIADFGLARKVNPAHSHVSTQVAGTTGYMPPEYKDGVTVATPKADVYSFGVLMLEVLTGSRPNWPIRLENGKEVSLTAWAHKMRGEGRWLEMTEASSMDKESVDEGEVEEYLRIACICTADNSRERPNMEEVVKLLKDLPSATTERQ